MSNFRKALLWTAIPIVALSLINAAGRISPISLGTLGIVFGFVALVAAACILAAIVTAIVLVIKGKKQLAAGVMAGVGIGFVALGLSCFAIPIFGR